MNQDLALPTAAYKELMKGERLDNNREVIKDYIIAAGIGIELTDKQKELLERWEYADEKIREHMGRLNRTEIANLIKKKFAVSFCTAKSDMVNAEYVLSSSNPLNKAHRIQLRIEYLEKQSKRAADAKDFQAVAMIEKSIAKYVELYPETTPTVSPKNLIFAFDVEKVTELLMPSNEAELIVDGAIKKKQEEIGEYIEYIEGGKDGEQ